MSCKKRFYQTLADRIFFRYLTINSTTVKKGYGHVKIKVRNEGTSNLTWSLQGNGREYVYKTVGKEDTLTWTSLNSFPNGMPSGEYVIQFRANGNKVEGEAWGTTGQYPGDIN
ncbi:hypothetical protein [Paenibacillus sp. F4]|uniref:hypothetical protein n=1 Tax=Paenibacillus sp. F4 TaxID=357385 RepID=UPI002155C5C3|nr:hypothetical protein [Paenibacillus sp. F4]